MLNIHTQQLLVLLFMVRAKSNLESDFLPLAFINPSEQIYHLLIYVRTIIVDLFNSRTGQ